MDSKKLYLILRISPEEQKVQKLILFIK